MTASTAWKIGTYLVAIVAANLITAQYGQSASVLMSFALIPFNLTIRDSLHEVWQPTGHLRRNMAMLILSGSVLSAALSISALPIAIASFVAFALAEGLDSIVFARLAGKSRFARMAGSNSVSSAADSLSFNVLAFGSAASIDLIAADYAVKLVGGWLWAYILSGAWRSSLRSVV